MGNSPATLPADFFSQPPAQQPEAPATLPADFAFSQASAPAPAPQPTSGEAPSTLPADFFSAKPTASTTSKDSAIPSATQDDGSITGKAWNWLNEPLTTSLLGWKSHRDGATGFEAGAEDFASGLTSPLSVGLGLATLGTGALEAGLAKAGLTAVDAAAYVQKAKLVADLGFLTKYGYDLGTNTLPQAEMYWHDYKNADNAKDKEAALDRLKQFGTESVLSAVASGLALKGVKGDLEDIAAKSSKGMALAHQDYANSVYPYQTENQVGSAQARQVFNDAMKAIPDEKRRTAIAHSIEAAGDGAKLEAWAVRAEQNPITKDTASAYRDAKQLSPKEVEVRDKLRDLLQGDLAKLKDLGLLAPDGGKSNYLPHIYDLDEVDPTTGKPVQHSGAERDFLKKRIFDSYADAEQNGMKPVTKDAVRLIADYHERAENVIAKESLAQKLAAGRTNEGAPLSAPNQEDVVVDPKELQDLQKAGKLDELIKSGRVYDGPDEVKMWKRSDYVPSGLSMQGDSSRVPLYVSPDIAPHLNGMLDDTAPKSALVRGALKLSSGAKSVLLSMSPFHWVTILNRSLEAGLNPLSSAKEIFAPRDIDYFNLKPSEADAIKNGVVAGNTRPGYSGYMEEGNVAGRGSIVNRIPIIGGFNKAIEERLFGPQGFITSLKFDLYGKLKDQIKSANPNFSDEQAGRIAATQVNNKFGGLNYAVLGRSASTQNAMRAFLLAPDFLESTGRSVLDLAGSRGSGVVKSLIAYNVAHWLLARGMNWLVSGDTKPESGFALRSKDDKKEYSIRTTLGDYLHFVQQPRDFMMNRVNPLLVRTPMELASGVDAQGHKVSNDQKLFDALRQVTPIPVQAAFPNQQITQKGKADQLLQSVGVRGAKVFSPAETLAMQKASAGNESGALEGDKLAETQKKYKLTDDLRSAISARDVSARTDAIKAIHQAATSQDAILSQKQAGELIKNANKYPTHLLATTSRLSISDAIDVFNHSSILEKRQLKPLIQEKIEKFNNSLGTKTPAEIHQTRAKIADFRQAGL